MAPERPESESGPEPPIRGTHSLVLRIVYGLFCLGGWVGFAWAWYVVFYKRTPYQTLRGVIALGIFLVFVVIVTLAWMRHNLGIHRRRGPRTIVPMVNEDWSRDGMGRPVSADWSAVRQASVVTVDVSDSGKTYTPQ